MSFHDNNVKSKVFVNQDTFLIAFVLSSACTKSTQRFHMSRQLYTLSAREHFPAFSLPIYHDQSHSASGISACGHEQGCRRVSSSSNGGRDKSSKGSGNQWSCPKCGNPCSSVERKSIF